MNILLGVTGSVAATLTPKIVEALEKLGDVKFIFTDKSLNFVNVSDTLNISSKMYLDKDEWQSYKKGDPVLHIDLKNWADIFVIAPCTANTLAKMANGLADNLLTNTFRAWPTWKPIFLAPAMNTDMWESPFTRRHLNSLSNIFEAHWYILPQKKVLACGDDGIGAMANIDEIISAIQDETRWKSPLRSDPFIPVGTHPGSFGAVRKHDVHTGVDLYSTDGTNVTAVEAGVVIDVVDFTGSKVFDKDGKPMDWWNDTKAVLVKGPSGLVVYGEIEPLDFMKKGHIVKQGQTVGKVKAVLPKEKIRKDIPHHSNAMLHIEVYDSEEAEKNFRWQTWDPGQSPPAGLIDPTQFLIKMRQHYY